MRPPAPPDPQDLVNGIDSAAAIGQLDVGEDEAGARMHGGLERGLTGSLDGNDVMSEAEHDLLEVGCDEQLILDYQHVGFHMLAIAARALAIRLGRLFRAMSRIRQI